MLAPSIRAQSSTTPTDTANQAPSPESSHRVHERIFYVLTAIGVLCVVLFALSVGPDVRRVLQAGSLAFLVGGAAFVVGLLLGFLFGIPRTHQYVKDGPAVANAQPTQDLVVTHYKANTNLEQISDWLTKMLVGVGLTQIVILPGASMRLGESLGPTFGGGPVGNVFAVALVVYFSICGFLCGYIWTSVNLFSALVKEDVRRVEARLSQTEALSRRTEQTTNKIEEEMQGRANADGEGLAVAQRFLDGIQGQVTQTKLNHLFETCSPAILVQIFHWARAYRIECMQGNVEPTLVARTIPLFRALIACDKERKFHRNHAQLGYALLVQKDWPNAENALSQAIVIREAVGDVPFPKYELSRAICRIEMGEYIPDTERIAADLRVAAPYPRLHSLMIEKENVVVWMRKHTPDLIATVEAAAKRRMVPALN